MDINELADLAGNAWNDMLYQVRSYMDADRIVAVRRIRCEQHLSWRLVALYMHTHHNGWWQPPNNQIAGEVLCHYVASLDGQNHQAPPWNGVLGPNLLDNVRIINGKQLVTLDTFMDDDEAARLTEGEMEDIEL